MRHLDRADTLQIESKGRNDFVTMIDRGAEGEIIRLIHKAYPQHAILGEESGHLGDNEVVWIIDPLDGTTNFLHRLPHFAVSIGVQIKGVLTHGVIYAPCTQDLYVGSRGAGATLNNRRIRVSTTRELEQSLIGTGVPIRPDRLDAYMPLLKGVAEHTSGVRRAGAASLDLAYVASGRLDGFFEMGLQPWDMAAGLVLVQEAGGIVSELFGEGDPMQSGNVLVGNPKTQPLLAELLRSKRPGFVATPGA